MSFVLDASATLAHVLGETQSVSVDQIWERLAKGGAWVPSLWRLEVANILEMGVRKGRFTREFCDMTLADLALLPIALDPETDKQAWGAILRLASQHRLTTYDAAYLELAQRRGIPLATLDADLHRAAVASHVEVLGLAAD